MRETEVPEGRTKQNVTNGPVPPDLLYSKLPVLRVGTDLQDPRAILRWQMVLEALLLICSIPQMDDAAKAVSDNPAVASESATKDSSVSSVLPAMPMPKSNAEAIQPAAPAQPFLPVKPVFARPRETHRQR